MVRPFVVISLFIGLAASGGCGLFRPIPSHGGGKRFDEEQRIVASAIRHTLADMDLSELQGKKVQLAVEIIAQDGGGTVQFPGVSNINAGISGNLGEGNVVQFVPSNGGAKATVNDNFTNSVGGSVGFGIRPETFFSPSVMSTSADGGYFKASLEMKARHAGLVLSNQPPDATLYVLVDVLGTNRSHFGNLIVSTEKLVATCECTYYAQDTRTGELIFRARRASSAAGYTETRGWGVKGSIVDRTTDRIEPTDLPIDAEHKPTSQPSPVVQRRPWLDEFMMKFAGAGD